MMLALQICGALCGLGILLTMGSILVGMTSQSRYTDDTCALVLTVGFLMFVFFGAFTLAIKYGGA